LADAACRVRTDPVPAIESMAVVADTGRQAMGDMRRLLGLLRDETETMSSTPGRSAEVDPPQPGIAEIDALVDRVKSTGLPLELEWRGQPFALSEAAQLTVYRIVQEALTNALRHARSAEAVRVTLTFTQPDVSVRVTDDGCGPRATLVRPSTTARRGLGVTNMTERAAAFGGTLSAGPDANGGWKVETTLHGCSSTTRV
jgi:signal transduction histidine kinase